MLSAVACGGYEPLGGEQYLGTRMARAERTSGKANGTNVVQVRTAVRGRVRVHTSDES